MQVTRIQKDLTIILPAYNEEAGIGLVLEEAKLIGCKFLVGDNNSTDRTKEVCEQRGIKPLSVLEKGKGNVIRELINRVATPYIVMVNSDYTYPLKYIPTIYSLLSMQHYDVVIGPRQFKEPGSMPFLNSFGNWGLSILASTLYGFRVYDLCTGMWGFRTEIIKRINIESNGFTLEAEFFSKAVKNKCKIGQIPISYRPRLNGSQAKLKISDGFKIGWFLVKERFR